MADGALTRRQEEVISLVADGWENRAIAARLAIAPATVSNHLQNAYDRLGIAGGPLVSARILAVRYWLLEGQQGADDGREPTAN